MVVNVSEAKTNLSKLINLVYSGEKITIAKNNLPIVDLVIHKPEGKRKLGILKKPIQLSDDFFQEDDEINSMFYGEEK